MPKRNDIKSILIIGAGPIVIGQACEFDYSGAQACKALKEEGYRVILVNSNPATIMTDPSMADATYIEPITWQTVERIIDKERPDAILPTMGGQTALNCALDLDKYGVLAKYGCELIGATKEAIEKAEDRELFDKAMKKIGLECPRADVAETMDEALAIQARFGQSGLGLQVLHPLSRQRPHGGILDRFFSWLCQTAHGLRLFQWLLWLPQSAHSHIWQARHTYQGLKHSLALSVRPWSAKWHQGALYQ